MNAVSKHGVFFRKPMSGLRFFLNPDFLRLANEINYDHGRGPRFLEPAEPPLATPLIILKFSKP